MKDIEIEGDLWAEYEEIQAEEEDTVQYATDDELRALIGEVVESVLDEDMGLTEEDMFRDGFLEQYEEYNG